MEGANYRIDAEEIIFGLLKNPIVYLRMLGVTWRPYVVLIAISTLPNVFELFSIIVFGCLADKAYANDDSCLINDSNACNFGIAVGVIGMLMCLGFFTKDIVYIIVKQNKIRGVLLLVDAAAFAFWGFFWFVSFCFMADQWRRVNSNERDGIKDSYGESAINNIQAAITFTFFSILVWVAIVVLNIFFTVRGPGFPWNPKAEGVMTPGLSREDGYAAFPDQDASDDNYQPPEY